MKNNSIKSLKICIVLLMFLQVGNFTVQAQGGYWDPFDECWVEDEWGEITIYGDNGIDEGAGEEEYCYECECDPFFCPPDGGDDGMGGEDSYTCDICYLDPCGCWEDDGGDTTTNPEPPDPLEDFNQTVTVNLPATLPVILPARAKVEGLVTIIAPVKQIIVTSSAEIVTGIVNLYNTTANVGNAPLTGIEVAEAMAAALASENALSAEMAAFEIWLAQQILQNITAPTEDVRFEDCEGDCYCDNTCVQPIDCPNTSEEKDINGDCVECAEKDSAGKCVPCGEDEERVTDGSCKAKCTDGKVRDVNDNCVECDEKDASTNECIPCADEKVRNAAGKCVDDCTTTTGYLWVDNFVGTVSVGEYTLTKSDNFRDESDKGNIILSANCDTGKINIGDVVTVLSTTKETRTYTNVDSNGKVTSGTAQYYKVSYKNCEGNKKENADYDPEKPCSDCTKGNVVINPEIQPQTTACGVGGGMYGYTRGVSNNCTSIKHGGVDIKNNFGDTIYAMFDGTATIEEQADGAGYYVIITSAIDGDTIKSYYFHMQKDNRVTGRVTAGDIIGYQGDSGNLANGIKQGTTESHVHVKIKVNGVTEDPLPYFKTEFNSTTGVVTNSGCD